MHAHATIPPSCLSEATPIWSLGLLFVVQVALMNFGLERTTAAPGVKVLNSYAVHTVVFAHFLFPGDRLTPPKLAGVLIAYRGVVLLFARSFSMSSSTLAGDLIVALSAVFLGERIVYIAKAVQRLDPVRLMLYQSIIGSAGFFLIGFATEADRPTLDPPRGGRHRAHRAPLSQARGAQDMPVG